MIRCRKCKKLRHPKRYIVRPNGWVKGHCEWCRNAVKTEEEKLMDTLRMKP